MRGKLLALRKSILAINKDLQISLRCSRLFVAFEWDEEQVLRHKNWPGEGVLRELVKVALRSELGALIGSPGLPIIGGASASSTSNTPTHRPHQAITVLSFNICTLENNLFDINFFNYVTNHDIILLLDSHVEAGHFDRFASIL